MLYYTELILKDMVPSQVQRVMINSVFDAVCIRPELKS